MNLRDNLEKIAFLGTYLPRKCGIGTFTYDLCSAVSTQYPRSECFVVPINDTEEGYDYPEEVRFEIAEQNIADYHRAADFLNFSNCNVVSLQHEFGIFGGQSGSHILALLRDLHMPVVTTLHTVLPDPDPNQRRIMRDLTTLSSRVVVMSEHARQFLRKIYGVPEEKIDLIPHGIPDMPFVDPNFYKDQFGVEGKFAILTFGLLSPNKGIENVLKALPKVVAEIPNVVYIVLGATHPRLLREEGEVYRLSLERLARDLGIKKHVIFYNRFVELEELKEFLGAADVYITPYLNRDQVTSGTLSYAFGCGKAVISTPYWHAEELLADGRGVLVPFADPDAIATELLSLLKDEPRRHAMRKRAYMLGREMVWSNIAHLYMESFQKARRARLRKAYRPFSVKTLEEQRVELPAIRLDHLTRLTDSTGVIQHARYSFPHFADGYCTDDNARGLLLTLLLEELGLPEQEIERLGSRYAAFLNYAWNPETGRFRNFMSFARQWLEEAGSEDSNGRALWALGACVGRSKHRSHQMWAAQMFGQALPSALEFKSPRSMAFVLLGIHEYSRRLSGDRFVNQVRSTLTERLVELLGSNSSTDWPWFEDILAYDNAVLPHALIQSARWMENTALLDRALHSLRWLNEVESAEAGHFRPIGTDGLYPRGGPRAQFDQQPVEAHAMTSACLEAYLATEDTFWYTQARRAFEWFLGRNDLGLPLYNPHTGGCHDGLQVDRLNQNQGAESTLAFLLSLAEMQIVETSIRTFQQPTEVDKTPTSYLREQVPES